MNQTAELNNPKQNLDNPKHDVALTTSVSGNTISINGPGNFSIPNGQAATHCKFTLTDSSSANVQFSSLDTADDITGCPPTGSGNQSSEVSGINLHGDWAQFTDNNSKQGTVSYQWNFTCNAPYTVNPFDPIITNGGKSGPF